MICCCDCEFRVTQRPTNYSCSQSDLFTWLVLICAQVQNDFSLPTYAYDHVWRLKFPIGKQQARSKFDNPFIDNTMTKGIENVEPVELGTKHHVATTSRVDILDDGHCADGIFFVDSVVENILNQLLFPLNSCCSHKIFGSLRQQMLLQIHQFLPQSFRVVVELTPYHLLLYFRAYVWNLQSEAFHQTSEYVKSILC